MTIYMYADREKLLETIHLCQFPKNLISLEAHSRVLAVSTEVLFLGDRIQPVIFGQQGDVRGRTQSVIFSQQIVLSPLVVPCFGRST